MSTAGSVTRVGKQEKTDRKFTSVVLFKEFTCLQAQACLHIVPVIFFLSTTDFSGASSRTQTAFACISESVTALQFNLRSYKILEVPNPIS